jgi:hypothetical protein
VLTLLSKYLLQYKRVCIPNIGTFEIVQHPAQLNVADKLIAPPVYTTRHIGSNDVPEHQFHFFASAGLAKEELAHELFVFGERLKRRVQNAPFHWKGFGTLDYTSSELSFQPDEIWLEGLQSVPANKVLRENAQHNMLVGDQEMTSQQVTDVLNQAEYKRPWFIVAGWVLLIVALVAIIIFLYVRNFQTSASGLQTRW